MVSEMFAFVVAAVALLGSPGPGIAALVAVGRSFHPAAALRFYGSMQIGLAIAAGVSAVGLISIIQASALVHTVLMAVATVYLIWLGWTVASAPVGGGAIGDSESGFLTDKGAFFLGVANPKAYLAFASLLGSFTLLPTSSQFLDGALKWGLCVAVMVIVDLGWLLLGVMFGRLTMSPATERVLNVVMGATIVGACATTWF